MERPAIAGYTGESALEIVVTRGFIPHLKSRRQERVEPEQHPAGKARRWVVEATPSWMNRFRKILVRFEKRAVSYIGLVMFAYAFIAFLKATVI
jgi:transposase